MDGVQDSEIRHISRFLTDDAYNQTAEEREKYLVQLVKETLGCATDQLSCEDANATDSCFAFTAACNGTQECNNGKDEANCTSEQSLLSAS